MFCKIICVIHCRDVIAAAKVMVIYVLSKKITLTQPHSNVFH